MPVTLLSLRKMAVSTLPLDRTAPRAVPQNFLSGVDDVAVPSQTKTFHTDVHGGTEFRLGP